MSRYSGDAQLVSVTYEKTRLARAGSYDCYSFTKETLETIAEIFGSGWFVRDFQEGDDVDMYTSATYHIENPQYAHLLAHPNYKWGLLFFLWGANTTDVGINIVNLESGECKKNIISLSIVNHIILIYNTTNNTKIIATYTNGDFVIISPMKEMLTNNESLFVFNGSASNICSLDGEYVTNYEYPRRYTVTEVNYSRYVLVKYIVALKNLLFASNGDIMNATLMKTGTATPRIMNIQDTNYLVLYYNVFYFFRIEDNE